MILSLGYSPCPNDTYVFFAIAQRLVSPAFGWQVHLEDVETLNRWATNATLDVTKLSTFAFGHSSKDYVLLPSGGALGRGVGPLIVTREPLPTLGGKRIGIPGGLTTASLLLRLSQPDDVETVAMRYDRIMPAVAEGRLDAGLIIHESRFTFGRHGLRLHQDLGHWWEQETGLPLPLGGIAARRSLGTDVLGEIDLAIRNSLAYVEQHRDQAEDYIARHAQEPDPVVRQQHIDLYVNAFTEDLGSEGEAAVRELFSRAKERRLLPPLQEPLILPRPERPRETARGDRERWA